MKSLGLMALPLAMAGSLLGLVILMGNPSAGANSFCLPECRGRACAQLRRRAARERRQDHRGGQGTQRPSQRLGRCTHRGTAGVLASEPAVRRPRQRGPVPDAALDGVGDPGTGHRPDVRHDRLLRRTRCASGEPWAARRRRLAADEPGRGGPGSRAQWLPRGVRPVGRRRQRSW